MTYNISPEADFEFKTKLYPNYLNLKTVTYKKRNGGLALENNDKTRSWFIDGGAFTSYYTDQTVHEVISGKSFFVVDFDDKELDSLEFWKRVNCFKKLFAEFFIKYYKIDKQLYFNYLATKNNSYNGSHVYISISHETTQFITRNLAGQLPFFKEFIQEHPEYNNLIDLTMYCSEKQLRLIGSPKKENGSIHFPSENHINILIDGERRCVPPCLDWFRAAATNLSDFILLDQEYAHEVREHTNFDKKRILEIIRNSKLNIDRYYVWYRALLMIYSINQNLVDVNNFCANNGWGDKLHFLENGTVIKGLAKLYYFSFQKYVEFFCLNNKITKTDAEVNYADLDKYKCAIIKAPCGTGKTVNFLEFYREKSVLFVSYRVSLCDQILAKNPHFTDYRTLKEQMHNKEKVGTIEIPKNLVTTLESLHFFHGFIKHFDVVFLDEITCLTNQFKHAFEAFPKQFAYTRALFKYIMEEKQVFLVSANAGIEAINFCKYFGRDYKFVEYTAKKYKDYSFSMLNHKEFISKVDELKNDTIAIACNSVKMVNNLEQFLKPHGSVLVQTSNDKRVAVTEWGKYKYIIYSPCIEAGISFTEKHFTHVMGYFKKGANNALSCYQMLYRVRNPLSKHFYIFATQNGKEKRSYRAEDDLKLVQLIGKSFDERLKFDDSQFSMEDFMNPLDRVMLDAENYNIHSNNYLRRLLRAELKLAGFIETKSESKHVIDYKEPNFSSLNTKLANVIFTSDILEGHKLKLADMGFTDEKNVLEVFGDKECLKVYIDQIHRGFKLSRRNDLDAITLVCKKFIDNYKPTPEYFDDFYEKHGRELNAAAKSQNCWTVPEFKTKRMQYKVQVINPKLKNVGYSLKKLGDKYELFQDIILSKVLNYFDKNDTEVT